MKYKLYLFRHNFSLYIDEIVHKIFTNNDFVLNIYHYIREKQAEKDYNKLMKKYY